MNEHAIRLRHLADKVDVWPTSARQDAREAADAIEVLEAELARLRELMSEIREFIGRGMNHPSNNDDYWQRGKRLLAALDPVESPGKKGTIE